jgi:hypothetical protein
MYVSLLALITCYLVSYSRARGESLGLFGAEGLAQRADRIVMLGIAMAFSPLVAHQEEGFVPHPRYWLTAGTIGLLAVLNTATAVSRIRWTLRRLAPNPMPQVRVKDPMALMVIPSTTKSAAQRHPTSPRSARVPERCGAHVGRDE